MGEVGAIFRRRERDLIQRERYARAIQEFLSLASTTRIR